MIGLKPTAIFDANRRLFVGVDGSGECPAWAANRFVNQMLWKKSPVGRYERGTAR